MYTFLAFGAGLAFLLSAEYFLSNVKDHSAGSDFVGSPTKSKLLEFLNRNLIPFLFSGIGLLQLHIFLELSGELQNYPWFSEIHIPILFWIGPLTYLYFQRLSGAETTRLAIFHFLPGVVAFAFLLPYYFLDSESKRLFLNNENFHGSFHKMILILLILGTVLNFLYPMALVRNVWNWREQVKRERRFVFTPFLTLFIGTILLILLFVIAQLFYMPLFLIASSGLTILICAVFLTGATRVSLLQNFRNEMRTARYAASRVKGLDVEAIVSRLEDLMRDKRLFLDEDLTLGSLASELKIQTHQLSEILNSRLGRNFRDYVTEFRLEEAARLLADEPQRSVLSVVYGSGFKSKSAFHKLFQERYGLSPTIFRAQKNQSIEPETF